VRSSRSEERNQQRQGLLQYLLAKERRHTIQLWYLRIHATGEGEQMSELGRGSATTYDVLSVSDDMTISDLVTELCEKFEPTAKIKFSSFLPSPDGASFRFAVAITGGRFAASGLAPELQIDPKCATGQCGHKAKV
jgi:hypothetical protein